MRAVAYWVARSGSSPHEWEDAAGYSLRSGRAAVADGASASYDAQAWARHLVAVYLSVPPRTLDVERFEGWLTSVAGARDEVAAEDEGAGHADEEPASAAPWYLGEAAARGSFATFCGFELTRPGHGWGWRAYAVGDTCLLHVRGDHLLRSFPVEEPDGFDAAPALVTSVAHKGDHGARHLLVATGEARAGDLLLLATDAVAAWALGRDRAGRPPWSALRSTDRRGFARLVRAARLSGEMVDDDATLLRWEVG